MRTHSRARRFALTALCAGGTIGVAGLAAMPGQALAATKACSNVYASGSTLQTAIQQNTFTADAGPDGAFTAACTGSAPSIYYNTTQSGAVDGSGTGSGDGLKEFALQANSDGNYVVTPADSSNYIDSGSADTGWLDGFIGTDDPPASAALTDSQNAADSDPEPVPIIQAPIAIIVNLPAGCTISKAPTFRNTDLSNVFATTAAPTNVTWQELLTDAGADPSGCSSAGDPTAEVRYDGSGTSFAVKQYFSQIDPTTWDSYVNDNSPQSSPSGWPGTVSDTYVSDSGSTSGDTENNQGSSGEAAAVASTSGSIGYVNTANAASNTAGTGAFGNFAAGDTAFWVKVQNSGTGTTKVTGAYPEVAKTNLGNCTGVYKGTIPSGNEPDWSMSHVANPKQSSDTAYPLCTLTYDVAWSSYAGSSVLNPLYSGQYTGETPAGVGTATKAYLAWVLGTAKKQGQTLIPEYYTKLPANIDKAATTTVKSYVATS